ncbi:MAG: GNAT family N-acetyltransferase, partial [Chloroflexota bacterium]
TLDDARGYIQTRLVDSYTRFGFGLYLTLLKGDGTPIGICGLIKRDGLEDVDIGFAFLPQYWSKGYAFESASAVLVHGRDALGLNRIAGITTPDNLSSIRLLEKLGLKFERMIKLPNDGEELKLFTWRNDGALSLK